MFVFKYFPLQRLMMEVGCEVCFLEFDEKNRKPRVLPCGHTLCNVCVQDILHCTQIRCPFCRINHQVSSFEDLPVSFTLLNLATSLPMSSGVHRNVQQPTSLPATVVEPKVHNGICGMHGSYKVFNCITCNEWVCRDCTVVDHLPPSCTLMGAEEALESMKKTQQIEANNLKSNCSKHLTVLDRYQVKLGQQRQQQQSNLQDLHQVNKGPEACIKALKEEQQRVNKRMYEGQKILTEMEAALSQLMGFNKINTVTEGCRHLQRKTDVLESWFLTSQQMLRDSFTGIKVDQVRTTYSMVCNEGSSGYLTNCKATDFTQLEGY